MNHQQESRRTKLFMLSILTVLFAAAWSVPQLAAAPPGNKNNDDNGPIQVGYVVVTPAAHPENITVFETFGEQHGGQTLQAGVLPSSLTTHAVLFVNSGGRLSRNVGVAIANPGPDPAEVDLALYDGETGQLLADYASSNNPLVLGRGEQVAKYVTEFFESEPEVQRDFTGTLHITSSVPVAVIGIRSRGENFSTLPATSVSGPLEDSTEIVLAHFAVGGGWSTEIVIANAGDTPVDVTVDLFKQDGTALEIILNDQTSSSFTTTVPGHGVRTLAPRDKNGDSVF